MNKDFLIQLTNKLYQLTLLFPKKEPLRYKMREVADEILANSVSNPQSRKEILKNLEILDSFFEVAKAQNWVKLEGIIKIQSGYGKIKDSLKTASQKTEEVIPLPSVKAEARLVSNNRAISNRKQKILDILKERGKIQVWEAKKIFPEITKRTLRRDFESLLNQGLIERMGERNNTFYQLKDYNPPSASSHFVGPSVGQIK